MKCKLSENETRSRLWNSVTGSFVFVVSTNTLKVLMGGRIKFLN